MKNVVKPSGVREAFQVPWESAVGADFHGTSFFIRPFPFWFLPVLFEISFHELFAGNIRARIAYRPRPAMEPGWTWSVFRLIRELEERQQVSNHALRTQGLHGSGELSWSKPQ